MGRTTARTRSVQGPPSAPIIWFRAANDAGALPLEHPMNRDPRAREWSRTRILAGVGLTAVAATYLGAAHHETDPGMAAGALPPATIDAAVDAGVEVGGLLIDFVEPQDGEGGSESRIASLAASLDVPTALAGTYAEGEHLYRATGPTAELSRLARELANHPLVEGVEPDIQMSLPDAAISAVERDKPTPPEPARPQRPRFEPNDPMFGLQWHFEQIRVPEAWTQTRGEGAVVAVIDTGVAWKDLDWGSVHAKAVPDLKGVTFVDGETFLDRAMPEGLDDHAHGTHVAGTIAQATDNGIGVSGVAHAAAIMPLKVLGGDGRGSVAAIANAIRYAADHGAHVINMSLGGPLPSRVLAKAVAYAHDKGVTVVCAAGNESRSRVSYPAAYEGSVAVAATNFEGSRSFYSNWGRMLDVSAPGGDTRQDKNGDGHPDGVLQNTIVIQDPSRDDYLWFQGTSMASPHVAGVAALVVSSGVNNPREVERILKETAVHPNDATWDREYGAGIVDAAAAVDLAKSEYTAERGGLAGLLGGLALLGSGVLAFARRRAALASWLGVAGGAAVAAGVFTTPVAYLLSGLAGVGAGASAWALSALVPVAAAILLLRVRAARPVLVGLAIGYAALLLHGAVVLPTVLVDLPGGTGWDRAWLAINAVVALGLARRLARLRLRVRWFGIGV
ncbi:MAG: hypothetical protein B7733_04955, partial [Myxococcales bacterium FL481]